MTTVILANRHQDGQDGAAARGLNPRDVLIASNVNSAQRIRGLTDPDVIVLPFFWDNAEAAQIAECAAITQSTPERRAAIFNTRIG